MYVYVLLIPSQLAGFYRENVPKMILKWKYRTPVVFNVVFSTQNFNDHSIIKQFLPSFHKCLHVKILNNLDSYIYSAFFIVLDVRAMVNNIHYGSCNWLKTYSFNFICMWYKHWKKDQEIFACNSCLLRSSIFKFARGARSNYHW